MTATIALPDARKLCRRVKEFGGDDPFGIGDMEEDASQAMSIMNRALSYQGADMSGEVLAAIEALALSRTDPRDLDRPDVRDRNHTNLPDAITADLLAFRGVDPLVAVWIAHYLGDITLRVPGGRHHIDTFRPIWSRMNMTSIQVAKGIVWSGNGVVQVDALGDTVANGIPGMRLSDVLSHPVLDRYDLVIDRAESSEESNFGTIRIKDFDHDVLTPSGIHAISAERRLKRAA